MKDSLKKDKLISLFLSRVIPIDEIRYKIIKIKNEKENQETLEYHTDRWENIAGSYYMIRDSHMNKFSYVLDSQTYVIRQDHKLDFYKLTGISYQIIDLIHELIELKGDFSHASYKKILYHDDKFAGYFSVEKGNPNHVE